MEEVDNIIIHSLLQIGCDLEDVKLSEMSPETLVKVVSKCLLVIDSNIDVPKSLPSGMAQRFSTTAALAEACVFLGFRGDIGYQTFLYSNTSEVRKVLMFLIERLPKETEKHIITQKLDDYTILENKIINMLDYQQRQNWIPEYFTKTMWKKNLLTPELSLFEFNGKYLKVLNKENISTSIFEQNSYNFIFSSLIHTNNINIEFQKTINHSDIKRSIQKITKSASTQSLHNISSPQSEKRLVINKEIPYKLINSEYDAGTGTHGSINLPDNSIESDIELLKGEIEQFNSSSYILETKMENINSQTLDQKNVLQNLISEKKILDRINILLENPNESVEKLNSIIQTTIERTNILNDQWKEHETALLLNLDIAKSQHNNENEHTIELKENIKKAQIKIHECKEDYKKKQQHYAALVEELEKVDKKISRKSYTSRILEIIGNINKQKSSIDQILTDTKILQKEINNVTGQLQRQFTATDDLIFKTAKRNENTRKAYKCLVTLHSDCEEILHFIQEIGTIMREIRDLDDQIENIKSRNVSSNLERISSDLNQMKTDSKILEETIKNIKL